MIYGKLIGGILGLILGGLFGLLLGLLAGHWFDRGLARTLGFGSPEQMARLRQAFFESSFLLLGHVAKADGRVSEQEVAQAESLMQQLGISGGQREQAIALFKRGAAADFDMEPTVQDFREACGGARQVAHTLLVFLISMALADGVIAQSESAVIENIASKMGFSHDQFQQLLRMVEAQSHFHNYQAGAANPADQLADAYLALGVAEDCSESELKRAYRRLMSQHHPDKLIARGVPEDMLKIATEKAQEIQAAYELIKKSR